MRTIEYNTGLHIDHYAEIGFAGFANIVDAVGGVEMNIPRNIDDKNSGLHIKKGDQTLTGDEALAFVRQRYQEAEGDLGRTKNQQKFLAALASQTATPGTVLNPFKLYPVMGSGLDTLVVDKDMSLWNLVSMFWAMKGVSGGDGLSMNMPTMRLDQHQRGQLPQVGHAEGEAADLRAEERREGHRHPRLVSRAGRREGREAGASGPSRLPALTGCWRRAGPGSGPPRSRPSCRCAGPPRAGSCRSRRAGRPTAP